MRLVRQKIRKVILPIDDRRTNFGYNSYLYDPKIEDLTYNLEWHIIGVALFDHFVINRILTKSLRTKP